MSIIFQKPPQNYQYFVGLYNDVDYNIAQSTATGIVSNQTLNQVTLPPNQYTREGQKLFIRAAGRTSGTGSKSFRLQVNTQNIISVAGITPINNSSWLFEAVLTLLTATSIYRSGRFSYNMGETAGSAAPTFLGNGGIFSLGFDITSVNLNFRVEVDIAVAAETIRQDDMALSVL